MSSFLAYLMDKANTSCHSSSGQHRTSLILLPTFGSRATCMRIGTAKHTRHRNIWRRFRTASWNCVGHLLKRFSKYCRAGLLPNGHSARNRTGPAAGLFGGRLTVNALSGVSGAGRSLK